jgi:hypothetical protein
MTIDKLLGYAFLISMPLAFLETTTFVREYYLNYNGEILLPVYADLCKGFFVAYFVVKIANFIIVNLKLKKSK